MPRRKGEDGAWGLCDVCSFRYRLSKLKCVFVKGRNTHIRACPECYDPDHPQNWTGTLRVDDRQSLRDPRSDVGELAAVRQQTVEPTSKVAIGYIGNVTAVGN